jgi:hypothetical protein
VLRDDFGRGVSSVDSEPSDAEDDLNDDEDLGPDSDDADATGGANEENRKVDTTVHNTSTGPKPGTYSTQLPDESERDSDEDGNAEGTTAKHASRARNTNDKKQSTTSNNPRILILKQAVCL